MTGPARGIGSLFERFAGSWLAAPLLNVARLGVVAVCLATLADVIGRNVLGLAVPGIVELAELALVWAAFTGIAIGFRNNAHVSVELIDLLAPRRLLALLDIANAIISFCVMCLLTVLAVGEFMDKLSWGDRTMDLNLPQTWYWGAVVLGYAASVLLVAARASVLRRHASSQ